MGPKPYDTKELEQLARLLDTVIDVEDPGSRLKKGVQGKIDLLERALEAWRVRQKLPVNSLPVETFVQSEMFVDDQAARFCIPRFVGKLGSGTPAVQLQPRLLLFLLLHHHCKFAVYDIIEKFISIVWDELKLLDFKRTKTVVMRCFTNTHWAQVW